MTRLMGERGQGTVVPIKSGTRYRIAETMADYLDDLTMKLLGPADDSLGYHGPKARDG